MLVIFHLIIQQLEKLTDFEELIFEHLDNVNN